MTKRLLERVPDTIRRKLGAQSGVCLLNGRDVFTALAGEEQIIMACNARIKHVIPGILRAAEELDAIVAFELTKTEGGMDGGYTGQTPEVFVSTVVEYAERCGFTKPFIIHGDHVTVKTTEVAEYEEAERLLAAEMAAGFTSFAIDASFNPLAANIDIVARLARPVCEAGFGLEVELGEVRPVGSASNLTTVEEAREFLATLASRGVCPQLLAIDNGSKTGNYLDGQMVNIDLERTREIYAVAVAAGLSGLVQHGITGTPLRTVGKFAEYGVRKGNIGTLWQNVAHAGLPLDLMDAMRRWAKENRQDIKYATRVFKADIDSIPEDNAHQIHEMAYREAKEFITAFRSVGSAGKLVRLLGREQCAS